MRVINLVIILVVFGLIGCVAPYPHQLKSSATPISFRTEVRETSFYTPKTDRCFASSGGLHYRSIWGAHKVWEIGSVWPSDATGEAPKKTGLDKVLGIHYQKTIEVPSDKEFIFFAEGATGHSYNSTHYCGVMTGFTPTSGAEYEVLFLPVGKACNAIIREKINNNIRSLTETEITRYSVCP